jgi:Zn ribbon nucleic-acid-binding protein
MIPIGSNITATVKGRFPKEVECVECQHHYVYFIEREASGAGFSALSLFDQGATRKATERAERELAKKFENEVDIVPCPECGTIQPEMVDEARRLRYRWMKITGICLAPLAIMLLPISLSMSKSYNDRGIFLVFMSITVLAGLLSIGLPLAKFLMNRDYDPNEQPAKARIKQGRKRAISFEEFTQLVKEAEEASEKPKPKPKKKKPVEDEE